MKPFTWWRVVDGVAFALADSPAVSAAINSGALRNVYGSIEGAILHGGVIATAFKRKTSQTFDAAQWFKTGAMVPAGHVTVTTITAERNS